MFKYVHHVHYVVQNRDAMVDYLERTFGMKPDLLSEARGDGKEALYDIGKTTLQITEPLDPTSGMGKYLAARGPGVWHVAWGVDNLQKVAKELVAKGTKTREKEGSKEGPLGYLTSNIDPSSSHGLWIQLAEGARR